MPVPANQLPADVLDALERGQAIEAINLLRQKTGIGLKDAKDVIDAHLRGDPVSLKFAAGPAALPGDPLPANVAEALQRGDKIEAIKLMRLLTGLGLKEAKDAIDAIEESGTLDAFPQHDPASGLAPGEVPRSGGGNWGIVVLIAGALAAWYFLR